MELSSTVYQLYGDCSYYFGLTGKPATAGKPVAGDFDGDGKADPGMADYNPSTSSASSPQAGSGQGWNFMLFGSFSTRAGPWYLVLP